MPRNSSGTMSAPAGQPAVSGTTISSATFNTLVGDLTGELSDSLSRSGKGGMLASLRVPDGTAAAPAYAFGGEINSGIYRAGANDVRVTVGGVDALKLAPGGLGDTLVVPGGSGVKTSAANAQVFLQGNRSAADAGTDVGLTSTVTRTAGSIASFQNPVLTDKLLVDFQGLLRLAAAAAAAAIQPASYVTAITPNAGLTAGAGLGYWKDASGEVRVRGSITNSTGGALSNLVTTTTLPAGFRPSAFRFFAVIDTVRGSVQCTVGNAGEIQTSTPGLPAGATIYLDPVRFLAQQ